MSKETVIGPTPKCPQCGEEATHLDPSGTYWDANAHYWRINTPTGYLKERPKDESLDN